MPGSFAELLRQYTERTGITDSELARSIGVSRQTVFRWKEGRVGRPRHRDQVLGLGTKLRLSESETDQLLLAAGFAPEMLLDATVSETPDAATAALVPRAGQRVGGRWLVALGVLGVVMAAGAMIVRGRGTPFTAAVPRARPGETLIVVAGSATSAATRRDAAEELRAALAREVEGLAITNTRVVRWPGTVASLDDAHAAAGRSRAAQLLWLETTATTATLHSVLPGEDSRLALATKEVVGVGALWALGRLVAARGDADLAKALVVQAMQRATTGGATWAALEDLLAPTNTP